MIEPGKHVKYFLRNGMVLEGIVEKDTAAEVILKSLDDKSLMIIHKPAEDILLTKVMLQEHDEIPKEQSENQSRELIREKLQEVVNPTGSEELDKLNIDQLKQLVQEQEKQIIAQKKTEHFGSPGTAKQVVPYSNPLGLSAYSPRPGQKSIIEKLHAQEMGVLRRHYRKR